MSNERNKVLFITSEMKPFLEGDSPLLEVSRLLPQAIQEMDNEVRILVPRFGVINERRNRLHEVVRLSGMNITIDDNDNPLTIKVASIPNTKMQVYFLDNEDYFHRKFIYNDENGDFFPDNDERAIFFCKGALETVKKLGWYPDIIHCQGWMTSLIPLYLRTLYKDEPVFNDAKVVYSVYKNAFNTKLGEDFVRKASLNHISDDELEPFGQADCTALHLGGMTHADAIVKIEDDIAPEIESFINEKGKPVLQHREEEFADEYLSFYKTLKGEE